MVCLVKGHLRINFVFVPSKPVSITLLPVEKQTDGDIHLDVEHHRSTASSHVLQPGNSFRNAIAHTSCELAGVFPNTLGRAIKASLFALYETSRSYDPLYTASSCRRSEPNVSHLTSYESVSPDSPVSVALPLKSQPSTAPVLHGLGDISSSAVLPQLCWHSGSDMAPIGMMAELMRLPQKKRGSHLTAEDVTDVAEQERTLRESSSGGVNLRTLMMPTPSVFSRPYMGSNGLNCFLDASLPGQNHSSPAQTGGEDVQEVQVLVEGGLERWELTEIDGGVERGG
ncbi:hypothetical protein EYF80_039504 [Liparis tanakae]|uniref:Uncharacterized protein n=1 Tax=Liparis tanakae TaxID=230148 RepID=A0A4Z2G9U2_9TELE|nr:hypothetical protein EYF80_039504 [Liparis tanakae]